MEKNSTKSVRAKILLILLLLLLAAALAVLFVNRENIKALYKGLTTDTGEIGALLEQNQKDTKNALSDVGINVSEEDFDKFNNGELNEEEIAAILYDSIAADSSQSADSSSFETDADPSETGEIPEKSDSADDSKNTQNPGNTSTGGKKPTNSGNHKTPSGNSQNTGSSGHNTSTGTKADSNPSGTASGTLSEEEYNKKVADLVAKIYVIKANFTSTLSSFESNIISSYKALPAEQRTNATKARIVSENMSYVTGLEAQCDAQVKAVTDELSALMKQNGKDTSLVDAINSAYANEKELKKAYYISLYK